MNKYTLFFKDHSLEAKYQADLEKEKGIKLFCLVRLELIVCFLSTLYHAVTAREFNYAFYPIGVLAIFLLVLLIKHFVPKAFRSFLFLVLFGFTIFFIENIIHLKKEENCFSENALAIVVPFQLFIYAVLLVRACWMFCLFYYTFATVFFVTRTFSFEEWNEKDSVFFCLTLTVICFGFMSYKQEQTYRLFYKSIYESDQSLSHFKVLVETIIPNPILLVNYLNQNIEFLNRPAFEMLELDTKSMMNVHTLSPKTLKNVSVPCLFDTTKDKNSPKNPDLFSSYDQLLSKYRINDAFYEQETSLSDALFKYYNKTDSQIIGSCNLLKKESHIKFETLNVVSLDPGKADSTLKSPDHHYFELKVAKLCWEKKPCLLILFNDNTNLRKVMELQNLDEYKNRLLASVSHDLRTPLNGILGILEVTGPQVSDLEVKKNILIAQHSAHLLSYMINDFLDFSQILYKQIRLNLELVRVHEIISDTVDLIEFQARKKNLEFLLKLKNVDNDLKVYTDGNRIKQVLLNLLSNSLKFTSKGRITLSVKAISEQGEDFSTLKFTVKDTGIGIKESDKSKLFQLFSKLDQTDRSINKTGVGLGLTISQSLVKLLDRKNDRGIAMKSEEGNGSKFWFFVTSKEDEEENVFSRVENLKVKAPFIQTYSSNSFSTINAFPSERDLFLKTMSSTNNTSSLKTLPLPKKKILIVDDDLINLMIAQKYLEYFGLNFVTANNGEEAFQTVKKDISCRENSIILILMDCNMPILDGFQASIKILNLLREESLPEIPIIAVTANVEVADQEKCFQAGMKKFLTKPVKRKDLGLILQNFLKLNLECES